MFDVSFTELLVIGVVALVVIGPERLPKVARTLGHLVGRAQRYVNDVKTDIQREVELDELRKLKDTMQNAAQSVQSTLHDAESSFRQPLESLEQNTMSALKADTTAETATADAAAATPESPQLQAAAAAAKVALGDGELSPEDMNAIQLGEGETLEDIKAKLKPKKSSISMEMLDTANTYDDKVALVRMIVAEDTSRVASVLKKMIKVA